MPTATIYGDKMIYVSDGTPSSTLRPGNIVNVDDGYGQSSYNSNVIYAYMSFGIPESVKKKKILNGVFHVYARSDDPPDPRFPSSGIFYGHISGGYRDDMTWSNKSIWWGNFTRINEGSGFGWTQNHYNAFDAEPSYKTSTLKELLLNGVCFGQDGIGIGQIHTPYSSNKPYMVVEYTDISLYADGSPKNGFVDKHKAISLTVNAYVQESAVIQKPELRSATIKWRDGANGEWHELTQEAGEIKNSASFLLPEDSVTASTLQWSIVSVTSDDGATSNFSEVYELSTVDSISTAVPVSPINNRIDVESEQTFSWQHIIATGSTPTGYDLEYSADGAVWQTLASKTEVAETNCVVAANIMPAGKLWWRVRTYNGDGIAGEWSEAAAIIGYGAPPAPVIVSVTNSAQPTVFWQSATQIAYDLTIRHDNAEVVQTGETAGTEKSFKAREFLEDGNYTVFVRIKNSGLYWSAWSSQDFLIRTEKPEVPAISGEAVQNGIVVVTEDIGDKLFLLRDGVPIASFAGGLAYDYGAVGAHVYGARRVNGAGAFADSAPLELETLITQAVIAPAENPGETIGPLLQIDVNQYPSSASVSAELMHYAGRRYPVAVSDGAMEEEFSPAFAAMTPEPLAALRELMEEGTVVLYRNSAGDCAYCLITAMEPEKAWNGFTTWEMTLARVDYIERIDYGGVV